MSRLRPCLFLLPLSCALGCADPSARPAAGARLEPVEVSSAPVAQAAIQESASPLAIALQAPPEAPPAVVSPPHPRLEAALAAIDADRISADLHFIASDELAGRDTPSVGQRVAARYIRARLQRLGWKPGAAEGYFHVYELANRQLDELGTKAWAAREGRRIELEFGQDYFFHPSGTSTAQITGDVVFCGAGEAEDFKDLDLGGKWALCFDSKSTTTKARQAAAKKAGAIGVIVTPGPGYEGKEYVERFRDWAARAKRPSVQWPGAQEAREPLFPYVYLTARAGGQLFALAGLHASGGPADGEPVPPKLGEHLEVSFSDIRKEVGEDGRVQVENVCGFWPGSDPELSREVIVISAHYDHVGLQGGVIHNGADDNGSGTCGLLALAEGLAARGPLARSVLLLWVSGEEKGLWGSQAWTENPWLPEGGRPICNINIDMIGRNAPEKLLITPTQARPEHYNGLVRLAESLAPLEGFPELGSCDEYWRRSDHKNFAENLKLPVTFLFSDVHEDYHQPGDDPEKIDCDKVRRVTRLVLRMLEGLQEPGLDLASDVAK